jgi:hypothetical protein
VLLLVLTSTIVLSFGSHGTQADSLGVVQLPPTEDNRLNCSSGILLLALASTVIVGSRFRETRDHFFPSVGRVNYCWPSSAQSVLFFCPVRTHYDIFFFFSPDFCVFWNRASSSTKGGVWLLLVIPTPCLRRSDSLTVPCFSGVCQDRRGCW